MQSMQAFSQFSLTSTVVFGDSVMWGQGIEHKNKFVTKIASQVLKLDLERSAVLAHSGAPILTDSEAKQLVQQQETLSEDRNSKIDAPVYGEIPRGAPSIRRQVLTFGIPLADNKISDNTLIRLPVSFPQVKAVFVNGGINDIDARSILNDDFGTLDNFEKTEVDPKCRARFLDLLRIIRQRFPNALILTFGYHFIFSNYSAKNIIDDLDFFFDEDSVPLSIVDDILNKFGININIQPSEYRQTVRQCHWFMALSAAAHQKAVDKFNQDDLSRGFHGAIYIPSLHGPRNAAYAEETLIWNIKNVNSTGSGLAFLEGVLDGWLGLAKIEDELKLKPSDEVYELRADSCRAYMNDINSSDKPEEGACRMASQFHPNSKSAIQVAINAQSIHSLFSSPPSFRNAFHNDGLSITENAKNLGFDHHSFTYRQLFATSLVGSIRLNGIIKQGSSGDFPYYLMFIQFNVGKGDIAKFYRYKLNDKLPFIRGFMDGNDSIFPAAFGQKFRQGGLESIRPMEKDTRFSFFAYPTDQFFCMKLLIFISA